MQEPQSLLSKRERRISNSQCRHDGWSIQDRRGGSGEFDEPSQTFDEASSKKPAAHFDSEPLAQPAISSGVANNEWPPN